MDRASQAPLQKTDKVVLNPCTELLRQGVKYSTSGAYKRSTAHYRYYQQHKFGTIEGREAPNREAMGLSKSRLGKSQVLRNALRGGRCFELRLVWRQ